MQLSAYIVGSPTAYATIQAAVDAAAPFSVITVDPGTYSELVTVGKGLTIRGAQAGVDARINARQAGTSESIVGGSTGGSGQSSGFYITGNDVTIDGFTAQGNTSPSAYGAGIVIAPGESGTHILNNIIQNNIAGMYLANASATDPAVIQYNVFSNNNNAGGNGGRGIYTDGGISGGVLTNVTIDANFFFHNHGGTGTSGLEAAIALQAGSSAQSNIRITNNTFDGNGKALLAYNASNLTIQGNTITDSSDVDSGALRFEGGVSSVVIESNNIFNNPAPAVRIDSKVIGAVSSGFTLNYNNIYGNGYVDLANPPAGIQPGSVIVASGAYSGPLNAQNNWWGASNGPGGDGAGSGDVLRANGASVTYTPYNTAAVVAQQSAFTGLAQVADSQIQAVTFDQGGSNFGYSVAGSVNAAMLYRATAVTTETTADRGSAYDVAYDVAGMKAGQWLAYSVNVRVSGTYRLDIRVANASAGGTLHATLDGITFGGTVNVPNTGSGQVWQTVSTGNFTQTVGPHTLKVLFDTNASGGSAASVHWIDLVTVAANSVAPMPPANLVAIPVKASLVDLTWSNTAVNQTGFRVERSTDGSNYSTLATVGATTTAYSDSGLAPNKTYYYRVEATNAVGASDASNVATVVTPVPPPVTQLSDVAWVSATTGFGAIRLDLSVSGNPITLRATVYPRGIGTHAVSQIVYNLGGAYSAFTSDVGVDDEVAGSGSVVFQVLGDNNAVLFTSATLTKLSAVVHVNVGVAGVQQLTLVAGDAGDGNLYDHADWAGATLIQGAPPAPKNLQAASQPNQVALTWAASPGASTYNVYRGTSAGGEGTTPIAMNVSPANYLDTSVAAGVTYYYTVAAVNAGGTSGKSNETSATPTGSQAPAAPGGVQAFPGVKQISLGWPAVAGAISYNVYRGASAGGEGVSAYASNVGGTGFVDASVAAATSYYYKVTAVNGFGESPRSGEVSGTTLAAPAHIVIVVEENKDISNIVGFPTAVYINSLIQQGALFTNFHAVAHPSQPDYIAMFSGSTMGVTDDTVPAVQFNAPNLATQLLAAGLTFTGYCEDLPAVGSLDVTGGPLDSIGVPAYARKHNPWSDFSNVPGNLNQPFTAFPSNFDLLPTVSFVIPNLDNDMHDAPVSVGDTWLQNKLGAYATWAKTHNSLLVVTWDENDTGDNVNTIPTIIVGQQIIPGTYNMNTGHYGLLRTIEDMYNLPALGGASTATAIQGIWARAPVGQTPAAPTGLTPTPGTTQVTLDWQASSGATGYSVYRGASPGGEGASPVASGIATTHFVDTGVSPGTTYYYQVTASNSSGEGARSTEISTTTLKASPSFSGLTASSSITYGTLTVSLGGNISAGSLIPSGSVSVTINGSSTSATINVASGAFTANFDTHLLPASATAYTVTYSFAGNASFNAASDASKTLTVNPRSLTVTATGTNRIYDGTTSATVSLQDNRLNSDALTLTYASALFANKAAGNGKTINVTGISLSGTAASNYTLANTSTTTTANITARPLTVTAAGVNKVYDATTSATATLSDNRIAGDVFTDSYTSASFATKVAGSGKSVTVNGIGISGTDAANYSLGSTSASTAANITALSVGGSVTAPNKVYDATTSVTLATRSLAGVVSGDSVSLTGGTATFDTKNVGTNKTVTATGLSLSGADAGNYTLVSSTLTTTANITPASVTPTVGVSNKAYDTTTSASISTRSLAGVLGGDVVSLAGGSATFDTKNVGVGKTVSVSGLTLSGADAGNYTLSSTSASATANISAAPLTGAIAAASRPYDGTASAQITARNLAGVLGTDAVTLAGGTATFDTKNAGTGKTVTATGLTLSGIDAGNYALANPTETNSADITPQLVLGASAGADDLRLVLDANPLFVDWFIYADGDPVQVGQLTSADPSGLTFNGNGATDTLLLNYANGNPLPATLHLNGTFVISGFSSSANTLANTTLEIGNSTLYFSYPTGQSPAAVIRQALSQGYNNGTWIGSPTASAGAITSSIAATGAPGVFGVGFADSANGVVTGQPANTVEVRYTVMGDANLDRIVNMADATLLQANYNAGNSPAWDKGNFNFDAAIDSLDAIVLARNYNLTASGAAVAQVAIDPSPTSSSSTSGGSAAGGLSAGTTGTGTTSTTTTTTATTTPPVTTATGVVWPTSCSGSTTSQNRYTLSTDLHSDGKDDDRFDRRRDPRRRNGR